MAGDCVSYEPETYDVAVIGAGHAGCEAALAAARLGCRTLLLSLNLDMTAAMACNPPWEARGRGTWCGKSTL